ncbi:hypothetical protein HJC23_002037 [Cyclotella cryptica]|uniref:Uncharacterized protein n=1 Tax=Cyclotella cryptica TaxID=29204 RepID=A0ABD3QBV3_9STRA|eukprot:CCRYP_008265-RA/>CCRYP_008265-RA protein AED:0.15 eAED:0.15 QI:0/-1/0/1/-1/1/1/0/370
MLPLLAISFATVAGVMLFGAGDFQRLFLVFPTYQITSFKVINWSLSLPRWMGVDLISHQASWSLYQENVCKEKGKWRCLLWDWEVFFDIINSMETETVEYARTWGEYGLLPSPLVNSSAQPQKSFNQHASFEVSAEIHAGVSINNSRNSFGAHLHRAILDLYHQDWDGTLVHIGTIQDRGNDVDARLKTGYNSAAKTLAVSSGQSTTLQCDLFDDTEHILNLDKHRQNETHWCTVKESAAITGFESPSFSILPRQVVHTVDDAIAIRLQNVSLKTMIYMLYQLVRNGNILHVTSSAVIYLKTLTSSVPMTAGAICDNILRFSPPSINTLLFDGELTPWVIIDEADCKIERLATGWGNVNKMRWDLRELVI